MHDVLALQPGDMIQLYNVKVTDPFRLYVGNIAKFLCMPGVVGKKMAVQITRKLGDIQQSNNMEELVSTGEELL
jgi:flagellar motor switch protein FliM